MEEDFSKYMNPPVCPVNIGDRCLREDFLIDETEYFVKNILVKNGKWYAVCQYVDEFSGGTEEEEIYVYNLKKVGE